MSRALAGALIAVFCLVQFISGCESRSDPKNNMSRDSGELLDNEQDPRVRLPKQPVGFHLTAKAINGESDIELGKQFEIEGKIWSADPLPNTQISVTLCQFIEGGGLRPLQTERFKLVEAPEHLYTYGGLMNASGKVGPHSIRVVLRGEVLDEHVITVKE